jgi:uncharacterized protein (DUF302 family)
MLRMLGHVFPDILEQEKDLMIKEGVTTAKNYEEAIKEIETALKHSGAFVAGSFFLALGRC